MQAKARDYVEVVFAGYLEGF